MKIGSLLRIFKLLISYLPIGTIPRFGTYNFFFSVRIARAEWKRLRDNHREALKRAKLGQNKLLPAQITTWKYAKAMQFLEPFMKYRITEDIEMESQTNSTHTNKQSEQDVSTTEIVDMVKRENLNKRKCTEYVNESVRSQQEHGSDALESFFECILKSAREMPQWMQTQVKKKIFAVIIEAEEQMSFQDMSTPRQHLIIETKIKTEAPDET